MCMTKIYHNALNIKCLDLSAANQVHYLSGPIRILDKDGVPAKPGDLLTVEICNLGPLPRDEWGFTAMFDHENGEGFLTDHFPYATKAIWHFEGIYTHSPHILGVRFPCLTHPGIIQEGTPEWEKIAREATRTIPGKENGGNCDIKNLNRGSKVYLPVFVEGANLSTGDMHFSQSDGEVAFCGAIEMSGFLELKCEIIRGEMKEYLTPMGPTLLHVNPIFEIGPVEPRFSEWLVFEGINIDESGRQHYLYVSIAYKCVVLNAIDYLSKFGYSKEQVYLLLSCCPCEGRISGIVDSPNAVATLAIPTAIFYQVPVGPYLLRKPDILKCTDDGNLPTTKNPSSTV
ncbi:hypothetical protein FNV43_RR16918 [Rhamnella rubrinervis]|uniref:Formamidase n=1 Tax=Rhamnella rubrinervis TaxID=2594499 RepID=A0A8K0MCT9_9ROSA|nr:hypothetical protein FNV43_RR16918 [Rhamnella rubrinervis]